MITDGGHEPGVSRAEQLCLEAISTVCVDGAGLSMMTAAGHRGTVCATDDVARQVEDLQFALGEGPCFDAFTGGGAVLLSDLKSVARSPGSRWPVFSDAVARAGVGALFAFPLLIGAIPLGALDLYRTAARELSSGDLRAAWGIADAAAEALLDARSGTAMDLAPDVAPAGASYRLEVHQATGMLSVQLDVDLEEALVRLRAYAYARDLDVAAVARRIVTRSLDLATEED